MTAASHTHTHNSKHTDRCYLSHKSQPRCVHIHYTNEAWMSGAGWHDLLLALMGPSDATLCDQENGHDTSTELV